MKTLFSITVDPGDKHWVTLLFDYWTDPSEIDDREVRCTGVTITLYKKEVTVKDMMIPGNVRKIFHGITACHPDDLFIKDLGRRRAMRAALEHSLKYIRKQIYEEAYGDELAH